ncbi:hypothetical protein HDF18_25920 [Mucilaginibacter sp. X5P1]|uniref:hypothetical protein n=1 Tax=Mucilaginibacter sp. X5P1 TaxID=2723088 RepID=UPI00160FBF2C|nr:hypothetical protein [Mucilaginibacter sp. X5P1]MBB6141768.1 hypothetical protein [Mucilaginibacter sp. X5P1]
MKLTAIDLDYINNRLKNDIKSIYQEPYDEIKDHIITAIEVARENGDQRNIAFVFDELMETHFKDYRTFEKIIKEYPLTYYKKITKLHWANIKYYLNWQAALLITLFVITGFYLPQNKITFFSLIIGLIATAFMPAIYFFYQSKILIIKTDKGKSSIVKLSMQSMSTLLIFIGIILNGICQIARIFHFFNPVFHPVVYILLLSCFVIYGLSSMRLCRQEFKIAR